MFFTWKTIKQNMEIVQKRRGIYTMDLLVKRCNFYELFDNLLRNTLFHVFLSTIHLEASLLIKSRGLVLGKEKLTQISPLFSFRGCYDSRPN